jgi:hypothetical protein
VRSCFVGVRTERYELLASERLSHADLHRAEHRTDPLIAAGTASSDRDQNALGLKHVAVRQERMITDRVKDHVVALPALREVFLRVVDHVICAKRAHHRHVPRAAHAGDVRAERFGDLHGVRTDTARCTVDQDLLPCVNSSLIAQRLKRGDCSDGNRGRLFEGRVGGLEHYVSILADGDVFREGARPQAEYFIAGFELRDALPDCFDGAGKVDPHALVLRRPDAGVAPHQVGLAAHAVPVERIDGRGANPDEDLIIRGRGFFDGLQLENLGRPVATIDDGLHRSRAVGKRGRRSAIGFVAQRDRERDQGHGHEHQDGACDHVA